jgi:hypothetical protein
MRRVLSVFAFDGNESLWWNEDGGEIRFFAQVSDFFHWGGSDLEEIQPGDLDELERAAKDVLLAGAASSVWAGDLFAARKRGMRPQGACYKHIPQSLWVLFNAAGPERAVDLLNPKPVPEAKP